MLTITDAYDCATRAFEADSRQSAWAFMEKRLLSEFGDSAVMQFDIPIAEAPKRSPTKDEQLGCIISEEFETYVRENPKVVTYRYVARQILQVRSSFVIDTGEARRVTDVKVEQNCLERWRDFGLTDGLLMPLFNRAENSISLCLVSNLRDAARKRASWSHAASALELAVSYFNEGLLLRERAKAQEGKPLLSPRERECMAWVGLGHTTQQIGDKMSISDSTVNEYCASAAKKLGAVNRTQACARAFLFGIVDR